MTGRESFAAQSPPANFVLLGPQPPPRHGVSTINAAVLALVREAGLRPMVLNTSPQSLDRSLRVRLKRWKPMLAAWRGIARGGRNGVLYASVSGGWGILWEIALVWFARRKGYRIILHHHSFRYIDNEFAPARWLHWGAGVEALHVVLCAGMERGLRKRYGAETRTLVLSNAGFMKKAGEFRTASPQTRLRVGHLSNLSLEKGLGDVVGLAECCADKHLPIEFIVAGPFGDAILEGTYLPRMKSLTNLNYLGPLYGAAKDEFFAEIDVFLFPTRYQNEAEPLVILEALQKGRPVIAYDRGCIATMIDDRCGLVVSQELGLIASALPQLERWQADRAELIAAGEAAHKRFCCLQQRAQDSLKVLLSACAAR